MTMQERLDAFTADVEWAKTCLRRAEQCLFSYDHIKANMNKEEHAGREWATLIDTELLHGAPEEVLEKLDSMIDELRALAKEGAPK